jgi:ferredoxin
VAYEELPALEARLQEQEILPLGVPTPARLKRTLPRATVQPIEASQRP